MGFEGTGQGRPAPIVGSRCSPRQLWIPAAPLQAVPAEGPMLDAIPGAAAALPALAAAAARVRSAMTRAGPHRPAGRGCR